MVQEVWVWTAHEGVKRSSKDWLYILGLFLITVLTSISSISQGVKAVIIIAIFVCVVIVKYFIKDKDPTEFRKEGIILKFLE